MNASRSDDPGPPPEAAEFPRAKVERRQWRFPVIWLVPVVAALVAAYLMYDNVREFGPLITIQFKDVNGLKSGQTLLKYRGVPIGEVVAIELRADQQAAVVKVRLQRSAAPIARKDSVFWIVRPEVGLNNISGLGTVITGPEIGVQPGVGAPAADFVGLDNAPVTPNSKGLSIVLRTPHLGSVKANSPVYYRGVVVGTVLDARLSADASAVNVHMVILPRYAALVHAGSRFWKAGGVDVHVGLFSGLQISVESLRSLLAGGVAFATPPVGKGPVANGTVFPLFDKPDKAWLEWAPHIAIGQAPDS
ncbi:MAG: MlaD family protein [Rhodocyclaceae bacterium]|nr:MlaD family protein [Rhodocyclaceae bacterium]